MNKQQGVMQLGGVTFYHAGAFWFGVAAVTLGVIGHLPMYLMGKDNGYRLVGMPMDMPMILGMASIVVGILACLYGLYPRAGADTGTVSQIRIEALDDVAIRPAHIGLLVVMALAVTIDVMKPTALAFVMPGMALEYDLLSPVNPTGKMTIAYFPLVAVSGITVGSFVWGWLGDKLGRRASILFAGIFFIATSICGTMPSYFWNMVMCFMMGISVGGMLPIAYTLLAETIPARHRGWILILIGSDIAGAYVLTSWLAAALVPEYSWRILWLIGLPTGLCFIMLNRWIPESPRFLLANGREAEARAVMQRYGAKLVDQAADGVATVAERDTPVASRWSELISSRFIGLTLVVSCLGFGVGLVLFGFNLWLPSSLRKLGFTEADSILRNAAVLGLPLTFVVAWMYGFWSSRKTIIVLASFTAASLLGFFIAGDEIIHNRPLLYALLVLPLWGVNSLVATLLVYSSEIYPTRIRSMGSGFAAGAHKSGGALIIASVAFGVAPPSISGVALIGAIAMMVAVVAVILFGVETRKRRLEDITPEAVMRLPAEATSL
jgi:MFS transporter, putative metabolite:H+ symporter